MQEHSSTLANLKHAVLNVRSLSNKSILIVLFSHTILILYFRWHDKNTANAVPIGQFKAITSVVFYNLKHITRIKGIVSEPDLERLIHALVSRLDYCNGLLTGL